MGFKSCIVVIGNCCLMLGSDHTRIMLRLLKRTIRWCYRHRVIIFSSLSIVFAIVLISYLQFMSTKVDGDHTNESKFVLKTTELIEQKTQEVCVHKPINMTTITLFLHLYCQSRYIFRVF